MEKNLKNNIYVHIYECITELLCRTLETNTTLYINYTSILKSRFNGLQGRNRDTDRENKRMDTQGEKRGGGVMVG